MVPTDNNKMNIRLDLRIVVLILLIVIAGMLFIWKPWSSGNAGSRTVEAAGEAIITATPDEYVFYPSYSFKNADKTAALAELSKKSEEVVTKLKELGVPESKIKTNSSGYDMPVYNESNRDATYNLQLTVTIENKDLAQKVQDYLVTTAPTGGVSPQANFSDKKRQELETKARNDATKDARTKAEQMAKNLGFKLGKVKAVTEGQGFGIMPMEGRALDTTTASPTSKLGINPGENELSYTVRVTYFIR